MTVKPLEFLLSAASGRGNQRKLIILIYHRILAKPDFMHPYNMEVHKFHWQMGLLASHFNVLPLTEAMQKLETGSLPPRAVCITFDDGYADHYHNVLPILKKYSLPATFFIVSGVLDKNRMWNDDLVEAVRCYSEPVLDLRFLNLGCHDIANQAQKHSVSEKLVKAVKYLPYGERNQICQEISGLVGELPDSLMLNSEQLRYICEQGMEIGSHSVSHPILKGMPRADWQQEISLSKLQLEQITGHSVKFFAFPNGKLNEDFTIEHCHYIRECGYLAALTTNWGCVKQQSDRWILPRFTPWDDSPKRYLFRMIERFLLG